MKNNGNKRNVLFVCISVLIVALFAAGVGIIKFPFSRGGAAKEIAKDFERNKDLELNLKQSPGSQNIQINTAELLPYTIDEKENIAIYEQLNEAVVNITTEIQAYNWFLEPVPQDGTSGSGTIIDTRGLVLTNNHVIENAIKVFINLADGTQIEGSVKGTDPENDLAVIEFKPPKDVDLKTIPFGDSGNLRVGQKVLAIGNPFAFERTLSVGIVSGLGRPIQTSKRNIIRGMIQTDASINPGNSGGPLLDAQGKMIGVTTMIYSPSGGSVGIGFAVPVNTAKRVVSELITYGKMRRGWFDATLVQVFPALVRYAKLPTSSGMLVSRTTKNGLSEKAGLKQGNDAVRYGSSVIYLGGDIITSVDGIKTDTLADLYSALEDNKGGEIVDVEVLRDGKTVKLRITLADREEVMN
ncbi:peptidase S1 [Spirochaetia bacterium]|nr:peptidase S1 [Spirochaetia bacterium]